MQIREVTKEDDRSVISEIYERSWKYAYKGIIPDSYLDAIEKGHWAEAVDRPGMQSFVMMEDGKMIGTTSFCKSRFDTEAGYGEIVSIYFLPEYIGKGYGKRLLRHTIRALAKQGYTTVTLWVLERNERARSFYKQNNFCFDGRYREDVIGGKVVRELQYACNALKVH